MVRKLYLAMALALATMVVAAGAVFAAVTFDPDTGTGFVGKGDVQLALGYNNKQLQDNANFIQFRASTVSERSWTCTNANNQNEQVRERTTTTEGIVDSVARERNQVTGFNLEGYSGTPTSTTEGSPLNSCPSGPWTLTEPAGDPEVISQTLEVSRDGTNWFALS